MRKKTSKSKGKARKVRAAGTWVHADVTLRSQTGQSIYEKGARIEAKTMSSYLPPSGAAERAIGILKSMGLRVTARGQVAVCIAAPRDEFEKAFGVKLTMKRYFPDEPPGAGERKSGEGTHVYFLFNEGLPLPVPEGLRGLVEVIHLAAPVRVCLSPDPPSPGYFHLKPPDVARLLDAVQCHRRGITGAGLRFAMADFGNFSHPYYDARGYHIEVDDSLLQSGETSDSSHGTAIAANAFAVAPGVHFIGISMGGVLASLAAVLQALSHSPDVLSISWGITDPFAQLVDPLFQFELSIAINVAGVSVFCACGNGGWLPSLAFMPGVVAVGGAYADEHDRLEASDYASSGAQGGRQIPDLVGLVGKAPRGIYITLPCAPQSGEDRAFSDASFPNGDETAPDDGWIVASGTSSATPQVAAVACLLAQADPSMRHDPAAIKARLLATAVDVTSGASANGESAGPGVDNATGAGLVDAFLAVNLVDLWMRGNGFDRGLVPAKGAHWESPDIKVLAAQLTNPEAEFDSARHVRRPRHDRQYFVYARARNRGIDPAQQVQMRLCYAPPCTFDLAEQWNDGQTGEGTVTVGGAASNVFGVPALAAGGATVVGPFVWQPPASTPATAVAGSGQHLSLFARLDCPADPSTFPYSGAGAVPVWNSNNFAILKEWAMKPEARYPLALGFGTTVRRMLFVVDTTGLPRRIRFGAIVSRAELDLQMIQALSPYVVSTGAADPLRLRFPSGLRHAFWLRSAGSIPVSWGFTVIGRPSPQSFPVRIFQYSVAKECIGGATLMAQPA